MLEICKEIAKDNKLGVEQKGALANLKIIANNTNNELSPKTMGLRSHTASTPSIDKVKLEWDNISSIIIYMLNKL